MGAGPRFQWNVHCGIGIAAFYCKFPYAHSFDITFLCFTFFIGFGKAYDEA